MKIKDENNQLKLELKNRENIIKILVRKFFNKIKTVTYWENPLSWVALFLSLGCGIYSIISIYLNINDLPQNIALFFIKETGQGIVKDKYLLYFLPICNIIIPVAITKYSKNVYDKYKTYSKFILLIVILLSIVQILITQKVLNIYL